MSTRVPDPQRPDPQKPGPQKPGSRKRDSKKPDSKKVQAARKYSRRTVLGVAIPAVAAVAAVGAGYAPRPTGLGQVTGDQALADALRPHLGGHRNVAAVLIDGDTRFAGFGVDDQTEFEIGSVTKTFTGALVMTAIERGELTLDTTVGDILGARAEGSDLAGATISELVTHTAGLPTMAPDIAAGSLIASFTRKDPYRGTPDEVIDGALGSPLEGQGEHTYSNQSVSLAGQLVAQVVGAPWEQLVTERVAEPLGLGASWAPILQENLPSSAPRGLDAGGRPAQPWTMEGYAPSGGIRSNAADMGRYLQSMMDGSNPGAAGVEPIADAGEGKRLGVTWIRTELSSGGEAIWHNGGTGGFCSFCGWNPGTGRGVLLMTNTATFVDELAMGILDGSVQV